MPVFILVQTDQLFALALNAMNQLSQAGVLQNPAFKQVTNKFICNSSQQDSWGRYYDFSRTAAVTLRAFFIKALNLDISARVRFPKTTTTTPNLNNNLQEIAFPPNFPQLAVNTAEGEELYARYDQMLPHFLIDAALEYSLSNPASSTFARGCVVLVSAPNGWNIYHITTDLQWRLNRPSYDARGVVTCIGAFVPESTKGTADRWDALIGTLANLYEEADFDELSKTLEELKVSAQHNSREEKQESSKK